MLNKEIHVLCNDTLVENPSIVQHVDNQLRMIEQQGKTGLYGHNPELFHVTKVKPKLEDDFWVNLIGKGYPSPNRWFRWCTERLKINPTNDYIGRAVVKHGQVIIVLGTRRAESSNRAASMNSYNTGGRLRSHVLPNAFVYAPIAELSDNDVWAYLLQVSNPWGGENMDLLELYGSACSGGECPFVIETGTQSCGKSRFGCWVCTVVDKDKSMENFVKNGEGWMDALLNFRNWLQEIRQEDSQYVPKAAKAEVRFGAFLLKTRREILDRLLTIENRLRTGLVNQAQLSSIRNMLAEETKAKVDDGLKKFVYELPNGKKIAVISDYDIAETPRKRLGPLHLDKAKLISIECVEMDYSKSTRVTYYQV